MYKHNEFMALSEAVRSHGGELLPDRCEKEVFKTKYQDSNGKWKTGEAATHGCKHHSRFVLPYEIEAKSAKEKNAKIKRGGGFVTVCGYGDLVGHWPKYRKAVKDAN